MVRSFDIVVAADLNSGIGKGGRLPWKLPGDMTYFRELTTFTTSAQRKNAVIMGRKTWESIPEKFRPLSGRVNVVLTRNAHYPLPANVVRAQSLDEALQAVSHLPVEKCFVIGGADVYKQAVGHPGCRLIYLTEVQAVLDCDTFFPDFREHYTEVSASEQYRDGDIGYRFKVFSKGGAADGARSEVHSHRPALPKQ